MSVTAEEIIATLGLKRHPEGGWYSETFRDDAGDGARALSTAIYFLIEEGEVSAWHRVKHAAEVWHYYAGAPAELVIVEDHGNRINWVLGADFSIGEQPQIVVPAGCWQTAKSLGAWTLCGCTVAPGFEFSDLEIAQPGWVPA